MNVARRLVVGSLGLWLAGLGCSGSSGSPDGAAGRDGGKHETRPDPGDAPAPDADAATADAPVDGAGAGTDRAPDATPDAAPEVTPDTAPDLASDAGVDSAADIPAEAPAAADARDGGDASPGTDAAAGRPCGDAACIGSNWAQWPMPNTAADVANGAPHPAMLVDNGDDTVTDGVTGLMWQRTASITLYNRAPAQLRCERLRAGGHADWRIPSVIELESIVDYDHYNSSIDATAFPDSPIDLLLEPGYPIAYFSTSTVAGTPLAGWLISFTWGGITLDTTALDRGAYARCVRGPLAPASDTSAGRYDLSVDGVARDTKTGLTWQRTVPNTRRKLADAKTYCATGTGLPGTGWRVPTIKELVTLVDFTKATSFHVDETVFNIPTNIGDPYGVFWSATSVVGKPPYSQFTAGAWSLYFDKGWTNAIDSTGFSYVRCVR